MLAKFKFGGGTSQHHHKHCTHVYQEAFPSSCLKYLDKAMSLNIHKKYNWQHASVKLAICKTDIDGYQAGPRALLHAVCHYMLWTKIILVTYWQILIWQFYNPDCQTTKFNSSSNFRLYGMWGDNAETTPVSYNYSLQYTGSQMMHLHAREL